MLNTRTNTYQSQINFFVKPLQKEKSPSKKCANAYTFGFNGKEMDNETYGTGNEYDFGSRIYNPRLGRWLSLDPLMSKYPYLSPYNFVANSPISMVDPDGRDNIIYLVVLPDASSQLKPADVKAIAQKATDNFKSMGLKTTVVVVESKGPMPPDFDAKNMDKTDAVAVIGGSRKSAAEFIKKNVDADRGNELLSKGNWVENTDLNPEASEPINGNSIAITAQDLPGWADKTGLSTNDAAALLINHGAGHNADGTTLIKEHNIGGDADVMSDGNKMAKITSSGGDVTTKEGNTDYSKNMKSRFGDNKPKDNYEKNKSTRIK